MSNLNSECVNEVLKTITAFSNIFLTAENAVLFLITPIMVSTGIYILNPLIFLTLSFWKLSMISIGLGMFTLAPCILLAIFYTFALVYSFQIPSKFFIYGALILWVCIHSICIFVAYILNQASINFYNESVGLPLWMGLYGLVLLIIYIRRKVWLNWLVHIFTLKQKLAEKK